jgi:rod shape-determining protein MreC
VSSRHRTERLAVLGSAVQRAATEKYPSRSNPAIRRRVVLGLLLVLSLVLVTLYFREPQDGALHSARSAGSAVVKPFQVAAERVTQPFRDAYDYVNDLVGAKEENEELLKENERLRQLATQYQFAFEENKELRALLDYAGSPSFPADYDSVAATVISYPPNQFEQQLVIGAGSDRGIRVNDPVVNADGLVGKVTDVTAGTAQVTLLTDAEIAVSALDLDENVNGVVRHGRAGGDSLVLDLVEKRYTVYVDDEVVTSGAQRGGDLDSPYPEGIRIGTVTYVNQSDTDPYKVIQVRPAVDFGSIDSVLVLIPKEERR